MEPQTGGEKASQPKKSCLQLWQSLQLTRIRKLDRDLSRVFDPGYQVRPGLKSMGRRVTELLAGRLKNAAKAFADPEEQTGNADQPDRSLYGERLSLYI
ncbi:hypothetical protein NBRC116584_31570 [Hydrogenophaga sp. 5NK40-0174]